MLAEILNSILEPISLIYIDSRDLAKLVESKIKLNRKYQNVGLSLAATMGTFRFVFTKAQHFIRVGWV